ncbi:MAG: acyl-CoA dehydrogenase family protein, partial [Streptosporangiaceae bacterium]
MMQFICGYHDIDLRDATGLGHGGGRVHATNTAAAPLPDGSWAVSGTKSWIRRLDEAAVFCVFFKDPDGRLTAAVIDADAAGLRRRPVTPAGLSGWTRGELRLDGVRLRQRDILGRPGKGIELLREHFAHYRPLVAATALGAAAAACDAVAARLEARRKAGFISGPRDNALITLGRAYAQINAATLAALTAQRLSRAGDERAELWGCAVKAHGVDVANAAASELALLAGAPGFAADSPLAKARRDLN